MKREKMIMINGVSVRVTEEVYYTYYSMKRSEKTLAEKDARNGLVHYDAWLGGVPCVSAPLSGASAPAPEEIVIARQTRDKLRRSLELLPEAERDLIHALFYQGLTLAALAAQTNIPVRSLGCRRDRILGKLRRLMLGGFSALGAGDG